METLKLMWEGRPVQKMHFLLVQQSIFLQNAGWFPPKHFLVCNSSLIYILYSLKQSAKQREATMRRRNKRKKRKKSSQKKEPPGQKETLASFEKEPRGQRVLVDCRPLQGLVHLHVVQSILGLPSAPLRHPCLPRCAAVYVEQRYKQLACTSAEWTDGVAICWTIMPFHSQQVHFIYLMSQCLVFQMILHVIVVFF